MSDAAAWMEEYRVHMDASLDRLGEYLKTVTNTSPGPTNDNTDDNTDARTSHR